MANRFKQAAPKAKKLYKTGRYKTFAAAMKAALKKTSGRTSAGKTTRKKRVTRVRRKHRKVSAISTNRMSHTDSIGSLKTKIKQKLKSELDRAVLRKFHATKRRMKKKAQKTITEIRSALRKYM